MNWFSLFLDTLTFVELTILHITFITRLAGRKQKPFLFFIYFFLLCVIQILFVQFHIPGVFSIILELLALYGINRFALNTAPLVSLTASVLAVYLSQLSFGMVNSGEAIILPHYVKGPLLYLLLSLAALAAFGLCMLCCTLLLKLLSFDVDAAPLSIQILLISSLFYFAAELYIIQTAYQNVSLTEPPQKHLFLFVLQALGLGALFCTAYAYRRICADFRTRQETASLTQAVQNQKTYVAEAQLRYEKTKAFRHDIRNHLSVLNGLLDAGRTDAAKDYLKKLEIHSAALSFPHHTGIPAVDVLLEEKLESARANEIDTNVSLILPKHSEIDDFDLCVIFANALDNAINACLLADDRRSLHISGRRQGDFFMLEFENTCNISSLPPAGTGLSNIKTIVDKYHGAMMTEKTEHIFRLSLLLNHHFNTAK